EGARPPRAARATGGPSAGRRSAPSPPHETAAGVGADRRTTRRAFVPRARPRGGGGAPSHHLDETPPRLLRVPDEDEHEEGGEEGNDARHDEDGREGEAVGDDADQVRGADGAETRAGPRHPRHRGHGAALVEVGRGGGGGAG